jgi:hypothetical protein
VKQSVHRLLAQFELPGERPIVKMAQAQDAAQSRPGASACPSEAAIESRHLQPMHPQYRRIYRSDLSRFNLTVATSVNNETGCLLTFASVHKQRKMLHTD